MKLYLNGTSPFARLVRATAFELELNNLELVWVDPWSDQEGLLSVNPLSRVPALVEDSGTTFTETLLILQRLAEGAPENAGLRADDVRTKSELGIAYGMMELAFAHTIHKKYCGDAGAVLQERRQSSLRRSLQAMEAAVARETSWNLSRLCLWIALDYIRFRAVTDVSADHYPSLNAFFSTHKGREALSQTAFA
jgi:glutathione S-transferase